LPLGSPRHRALLARLLLEPGRTVSVDTLLEDLWGEEQPQTAVKMIHVAVSQLRKVLPPDVLQTRPPGYVLQLGDAETDLGRFERLRSEGRLREALGLWRGPALAEFTEPFARRECARLEGLRLECLEDRIDADLTRGEHGALVAELETLVAAHPLRERPRRQLMLALYGSGRQADALAAYRDFREALDRELGIEPSHELRALELSMLRQEESVTRRPSRAAASRPVHYVLSKDVSIAYQVVGDGPLDIVLVHGWVCSFHPGWERPAIARFYERLGEMGRLILFDKRGTGLSDRVTGVAPLEERMDDLRAVLDAVDSERAAVVGVSEGGAM
jgi:DNA-binding SARP family transcriptional activator